MVLQMRVIRKCETHCWKEESLLHQSAQEKKSHLTFFVLYLVCSKIVVEDEYWQGPRGVECFGVD
jgi:hypothetical protein